MLSTWGRAVAAALALLAMALGGYEIVDADAPAPVVSDTVEIRTAVPN